MPRKPSEKNRAWEKERRERLNKSFEQLAKLLPHYDPSITWTKIEIIQKSIEHIEDLHQKHEEYMKSCDPDKLRQHNELIDALNYYQSRNGQLADLLIKAKISLPTFKLPKFLVDNPEFSDENRLGDINVKPVGRPGKYANKISKDDAEKIGKQEAENKNSAKPNSTTKPVADANTTREQSSENAVKELEKVPAPAEPPVIVTTSGGVRDTLIKTGVLVPVIPLQPQQALHPPVITAQPAPTGLPVPPLVNVTNLSSAQKVPKIATATHVFNYARERNGKIKILPQPQIKFYFRRADGKIPIPVLKQRVIPAKRRRKNKRKAKATFSGSKRTKTDANDREICKNVCQEQKKVETVTKVDEQITKPCQNRLEEESTKNKENMPLCSDKVDNDIIATLDIPQNESNPNSVSPTAAFLMSFPVVTSTGKLPEMMDDSEILTPNMDRKDSGVDNLENLNHFFTTKEYTKFCAENSERNEGSKEEKQGFTLAQVSTEDPKSKNLFEYFHTSVQDVVSSNQNEPIFTKATENNSPNAQKNLPDSLNSSHLLFSSSIADSSFNFQKQSPTALSIPAQMSYTTSLPNPSISVQSFTNPPLPSCVSSTTPLFSTFPPSSKPFFTTSSTQPSFLNSQTHLGADASICVVSTTNSSFLNSQLHLATVTPTCISSPITHSPFLSSKPHLPSVIPTSVPSAIVTSLVWTSSVHIPSVNSTSVSSPTAQSSLVWSPPSLPISSIIVSSSTTQSPTWAPSMHLPSVSSNNVFSSTIQPPAWSSSNIFITTTANNTISTSITCSQTGSTNAVTNYSFWPNTFTSSTFTKDSTNSAPVSQSQNLFVPTITAHNSISTSLASRCTPLPIETSVKGNINNSQVLTNVVTPTITTSTSSCKPLSRKNNLVTVKPTPVLSSFLDSDMPCLQTTIAVDTTFSSTLTTSVVNISSSTVLKNNFPPIMSTSTSGYSNPTFTPIHNNQKEIFNYTSSCLPTLRIEDAHINPSVSTSLTMGNSTQGTASNLLTNYTPSCLPSFRTENSHVNSSITTPLTMNISTQETATNLFTSYSQNMSQGLSNSTYTSITQNSVPTRNYYYPQAPSNFNLSLPTPATISSQIPGAQTVLPYPSIPYPPVTAEYKPTFTFSLTPSTTSYCKQTEAAPVMPPIVKSSTLPNIPYAPRESDFVQKPVFNPFDPAPPFKPPNVSITKVTNSYNTTTNFTFSLTNPKTTISTSNEVKPAPVGVPNKIQQQLDTFVIPQQFSLPFNQQTDSPQTTTFTFALTKTTKTAQKPTNSFSIDATLGIGGDNNPCFLETNKKTTNGAICTTTDANHSINRNKPDKNPPDETGAEQINNIYLYNQRSDKFAQKSHINWMTSTEGLPNTSECRVLPESYYPFTSAEDNLPAWSPSKMYDTHLVATGTAVTNFYGDIGYNTSTYSLAPAAVESQKMDKSYKPSSSSSNQANFFSVSQLVDQSPPKQYDGYQKKAGKPKDPRKQVSDFKTTCAANPSQTLYPEGNSFGVGQSKPSVSNSYSAEALLSKKEKHRNFGAVASSDLFPMDPTVPLYNPTDSLEQSYNSNYFYNYPTNQNFVQDTDYLGAYSTDVQFGKPINKHTKKLPPPAPPPPPPNLISYDSNYFPVPLAVNSPLMGGQHPTVDGYDPPHYNHSGNFQANSWGPKAPGIGGYHQSQHFQTSDLAQMSSENQQGSSQSGGASGNLTNFNMSTICPEISDKVVTPNVW